VGRRSLGPRPTLWPLPNDAVEPRHATELLGCQADVLCELALEPASRNPQVECERMHGQGALRTTNATDGPFRQRICDRPISLPSRKDLRKSLKGAAWISTAHPILDGLCSRTPNVGQREDAIGQLAGGNAEERANTPGAQTGTDDMHVPRELDPRGVEGDAHEPGPPLRREPRAHPIGLGEIPQVEHQIKAAVRQYAIEAGRLESALSP